jgi:large subunit ribosomal protein L3
MITSILGKKLESTQKYTQKGVRIPVTEIQAGPCPVIRINGKRVQVGFGTQKNANKPDLGQIKGAGLKTAPKFFHEVECAEEDLNNLKPGSEIKVSDVLAPGDIIKVTGISKGKGFQGVVKRHGFHGGPKTHGQSDRERHPGSIGSTTTPGRVYKGKRMAGRMGGETVSVKNLLVMDVVSEKNLLSVSGLVPGAKNGLLTITKLGTHKNFIPLLKPESIENAAN